MTKQNSVQNKTKQELSKPIIRRLAFDFCPLWYHLYNYMLSDSN